ncbi:MAG: exodeoxyribonuclease VII large subunit [Gammaproteobacteria bacterium]|nr:exodeoxyribonuclease VII large subunit [Gammaproteobacteria bacterium]
MLNQTETVYSVSKLNNLVREVLEENFATIWIEGEISNLSTPSSGHIYFTLKDNCAQIRAAMFRGNNRLLNFTPKDGIRVLLRAEVSLYEARGDYQLIVSYMEAAGAGLLKLKFEQLKLKLAEEGLFDEKHKKAIPKFPQTIGVVTSDTGAAIHDIITVIKKRYPIIELIIYPTQVQGDTAAIQISQQIELANKQNSCDLLIVGRGGGSLEDLWPFNEEITARAIYASNIPIISAVGHEIDFSISDFVADLRAATPSQAAELACPDQHHLLHNLEQQKNKLLKLIENKIIRQQQKLEFLQKRLQHPAKKIQDKMQRLDRLEKRLYLVINTAIQHKKHLLNNSARALNVLNPLTILERGYAVISNSKQQIIKSAKQLKENDLVNLRFADGTCKSKVIKINGQ